MSMIGWVMHVSPAQIAAMRKNPDLVGELAQAAEAGGRGRTPIPGLSPAAARRAKELLRSKPEMLAGLPPHMRAALEARLKAMDDSSAETSSATPTGETRESALDLHKSWHVLHYLFTGTPDSTAMPAGALLAGEEVGEDMGYGPPRLHDVAATRSFSEFLAGLDVEKLANRVDSGSMARASLYAALQGSRAAFEDDVRREIAAYFPALRDYVAAAAAKGSGLLLWIS